MSDGHANLWPMSDTPMKRWRGSVPYHLHSGREAMPLGELVAQGETFEVEAPDATAAGVLIWEHQRRGGRVMDLRAERYRGELRKLVEGFPQVEPAS